MPESLVFEYGADEIRHLKSRDKILGAAIDEIGRIDRPVIPDLFEALLHAIIGQQISTKAHETLWVRLQALAGQLTPERIAALPETELQKCGITMRKAGYIREIAGSILGGSLNLDALRAMPDEEVCKRLCELRGVGVWTAEMLMTFSMQRRDILSYGDLAILRGLRMLYRHRKITPALFVKYKRRYSPYATVASLYLWAIAGGAHPALRDPAKDPK
ncbi:MAG: DNA-3-methyladenine glycosylase 2 family protein, partial [Christensenellaceae bacterium]|nr:DNA-3-methyladenine glycosylase 2 family protein [Christensenellaceae bacterium]